MVAAVAIGIALAVAAATVGIAALALRERMFLDPALDVPAPGIRPVRILARTATLWASTSLAFAYLESYLHWRQGLGWHGLHCLTGPVHRDAIPILAALSIVAVALRLCADHLIAWMRRTIRRLLARPLSRVARGARPAAPAALDVPKGFLWSLSRPRGPPSRAVA